MRPTGSPGRPGRDKRVFGTRHGRSQGGRTQPSPARQGPGLAAASRTFSEKVDHTPPQKGRCVGSPRQGPYDHGTQIHGKSYGNQGSRELTNTGALLPGTQGDNVPPAGVCTMTTDVPTSETAGETRHPPKGDTCRASPSAATLAHTDSFRHTPRTRSPGARAACRPKPWTNPEQKPRARRCDRTPRCQHRGGWGTLGTAATFLALALARSPGKSILFTSTKPANPNLSSLTLWTREI